MVNTKFTSSNITSTPQKAIERNKPGGLVNYHHNFAENLYVMKQSGTSNRTCIFLYAQTL
jgi:hypothetical protein